MFPFIHKNKASIAATLFFTIYTLLHEPLRANGTKVTTDNSYSMIAQLHLPSLTQKSMAEKDAQNQLMKENAERLKEKKVNLIKIPNVGEVEKLTLMYNVLNTYVPQKSPRKILHNNVSEDLELFCGIPSEPDHYIFKSLDHTVSTVGKIELQKMLFEPTNNIVELQARQASIKQFIENEQLAQTVNACLHAIKQSENDVAWFWKQTDDATEMFFNQVYFGKWCFIDFSSFNKNKTALELSALWNTIGNPSIAILLPLIVSIASLATERFLVGKIIHKPNMYNPQTNQFMTLEDVLNQPAMVDAVANELRKTIGAGHSLEEIRGHIQNFKAFYQNPLVKELFKNFWHTIIWYKQSLIDIPLHGEGTQYLFGVPTPLKNIPPVARAGLFIFAASTIFFFAWASQNSINNALKFNTISNMIQNKMINVATYSNTLKAMGYLIASNKILQNSLPEYTSLQILSTTTSPEANNLFKMLESNTFKGESSFFSNKGAALAAFKMMQTSKNELVAAMQAAGKLDAYLSIAKLYKEYSHHPNAQFCFVEYKSNQTPYLKLDAFWHPGLNASTVVTNSIELGQTNGASNIILTGPNAGGKSTALKAITLAIILAQTFGIAPAKAMVMTPFTQITTYLNIADAQGRESLFQAEMRRAQELINSIRALSPLEFSFAIMDEIFTGTNPEEGVAGAYSIAKNLANLSNSMCIVATHYKKLTELAQTTSGAFKNCKVSVTIEPSGKIIPDYKITDGISEQKIALQLLQNAGFGDGILSDAYAVLNANKK